LLPDHSVVSGNLNDSPAIKYYSPEKNCMAHEDAVLHFSRKQSFRRDDASSFFFLSPAGFLLMLCSKYFIDKGRKNKDD
jgi:hypothetical protein